MAGRRVGGDYLQWLTTFLQVAERGSVHRAAADLCLSPSAASVQIKKLERDLGFELFTRQSRGMVLTQAGRHFHHESASIFEGVARLRDRESSRPALRGSIRMTCVNRLALQFAPDILAFRELHPEVLVNIEPGSPRRVVRYIEEGTFDFAASINKQLPGGLTFTPFRPSSALLYTPPGNPFGLPPRPSWAEICDLPFVALTVEGYVNPVCLMVPDMRQPENVVVAVTDFLLALHLVRAGVGVCIAPPLTPLESADDYTLLNIDHVFPVGTLGLITRRDRYISAQAEAFIEFLVKRYKE